MTQRQVLEKAKEIGGWYLDGANQIRTRNASMPINGTDTRTAACPVYAATGTVNWRNTEHAEIAAAADLNERKYASITLKNLRDEMEGWCK
jgi:hypothetical protein